MTHDIVEGLKERASVSLTLLTLTSTQRLQKKDFSRGNLSVSLYIHVFDIVLVIRTIQVSEQPPVPSSSNKQHPTVKLILDETNRSIRTSQIQTYTV